jgi:ribonuclease J
VHNVVLAEDGVVVDLVDGRASITGAVPCGYVYVDGLEVGDVGESTLKDRRILGEEGFISFTLAVDSVTGKVTGAPQISARGFSDDPKAFDDVLPLLEAELDRAAAEGVADPHQVGQACRRVLGKWVSDTYRRRPMIIPVVLEV